MINYRSHWITSGLTKVIMIITTLTEKKPHPIISKIPMTMWADVFSSFFNDDKLKIGEKSYIEIKRSDFA